MIKLLKPSTRTLSRWTTLASTMAMRDAASKRGAFFADPVVTDTTTWSKSRAARSMMSM